MSDSRKPADDRSGDALATLATDAGHRVISRALVRDEPASILDAVKSALSADGVDIIVTTGGTGIAPRDVALETLAPLFEKTLPGFGEIFRNLSYTEIGSAAMASRAAAGVAEGRLIFCLPGSPAACRLAMERLILPESGHLVGLLRR